MCINCMLCYAACPVYGLDPHFIGPAAIALAQRYNLDSRDQGAERAARHRSRSTRASGTARSSANAPRSVPRSVDPSLAIQQYKLTATKEWFKSFLVPRGNK